MEIRGALLFETGPFTGLELEKCSMLASKLQGPACLCLLSTGLLSVHLHAQLSFHRRGFNPVFAEQALSPHASLYLYF